jgi:signal transduction histidine kinase
MTFLFFLLIRSSAAFAVENILVLNSYHPQYKWTELLIKGIRDTLTPRVKPEKIHIEYMDARRFGEDPTYRAKIQAILYHKYKDMELDLILSTDDYAFQFLLKEHENIFANTPVVFGGVNFFKYEMISEYPLFTGVLEGTGVEENINLAMKINKDLEEILLISDKTSLGSMLTQVSNKIIERRNLKNLVKIYDDFTLAELEKTILSKNKSTAIIMLAVHHDNQGKYFSYDDHFIELTKKSPVPIYSMWGILMGSGTIGGYMNDPYFHGIEIATIGLDILNGKPVSSIPVKNKTNYLPNFDYEVLSKYNVSITKLPKFSKFHNRPVTYYQENKRLINFVTFIIVILLTSIVILKSLVNQRTKEANDNAKNLAKSNSQMKEFVGIVAHDLRAPVGNIISFTRALEDAPEDHDEIVPYILKSANKSINLINNILDISAIESGKVKIEIDKVDLNDIIHDTIQEVTFLTKSKELTLNTNINSPLFVLADKQRVTQILQNLLTNAIKFTPKNGNIDILVTDAEDSINVAVKDSGVGIPKDLMPKLFTRTEFTSRSGTEGESGTGYGLTLVYNIIKEHGSTLTVESKENLGSVFTFQLKKAHQSEP